MTEKRIFWPLLASILISIAIYGTISYFIFKPTTILSICLFVGTWLLIGLLSFIGIVCVHASGLAADKENF